MPEHNICVLDVDRGRIFKPLRETHGGFTRGLRDVFSRGVDLVFGVGCDVNCVAGEAAAFPDYTPFFGEEAGDFAGYESVRYG